MTSPGLLNGEKIVKLLKEVAELLPAGPQAKVNVVGGSLLALHGLRDSTQDVDCSIPLDGHIKSAARTVGTRNGLQGDWLNDRSAPWHAATLTVEDCDTIYEHPLSSYTEHSCGQCT